MALDRLSRSGNSTAWTRIFEIVVLVFVVSGAGACSRSRPAAPAAASRNSGNDTDRIIDSLLGDMRKAEAGPTASSPKPQPTQLSDKLDSFEEDRQRIRSSLEKWDQGSGAALRFVKQSTGERLSLIFIDETAPDYQSETDMWMIQATARVAGGKIVGHFVLFLKDLRAGRYRGDDHSKEAVMAVLIGDSRWDGENPETAWSMNAESWCDVQLQPAGKTGIEGSFRARLVDNKGSGYVQVESGYLFIKQ